MVRTRIMQIWYLSATCMRTDWTRRVHQLVRKYGFLTGTVITDNAAKWSLEVRRRVKEAENTPRCEGMEHKSTLDFYRCHKQEIAAPDL